MSKANGVPNPSDLVRRNELLDSTLPNETPTSVTRLRAIDRMLSTSGEARFENDADADEYVVGDDPNIFDHEVLENDPAIRDLRATLRAAYPPPSEAEVQAEVARLSTPEFGSKVLRRLRDAARGQSSDSPLALICQGLGKMYGETEAESEAPPDGDAFVAAPDPELARSAPQSGTTITTSDLREVVSVCVTQFFGSIRIYQLCQGRDEAAADDIAGETCVALLSRYDGLGSVGDAMLVSDVIASRRKQRLLHQLHGTVSTEEVHASTIESARRAARRAHALQNALARLDESQQRVLGLMFRDGRPLDRVAEVEGVPVEPIEGFLLHATQVVRNESC